MPSATSPKTINLALQGGGSHGAFTWGVLDRLLEDDGVQIEGISGTSAGALNAAMLCQGHVKGGEAGARKALDDFWQGVGSLAAFEAKPAPNTKKWYGSSGNSFVAAVEFGPRVRAKAVTAGGLNSVKGSKHFEDQTDRYVAGKLRDVYFYREDLVGHIEREYHPGDSR